MAVFFADVPAWRAIGCMPASIGKSRGREALHRHYNDVQPRSSLGYLMPAAFKAKHLLTNAPRFVVRTDDIL